MPSTTPCRPELLAPAGDWDCLRAAVANGADAVYFGLSSFNARHRAANFSLEELPQVMAYLHGHNVRGYVALNTLIFSEELPEAARFIEAIVEAGADAVIVQDLGLVRLIRRLALGLAIHGSTQMTLTEPAGVEFVRRLGIDRVIVVRELSIDEIGRIAEKTAVPLEVFVHGALCVAYSGQCLTSEALGGRSANRGQCAQACRLPYELVVDGKLREAGDRHYLLSPQDLAAHDLIDRLVALGVRGLKIEGRLKSAEYVAITSQTYRAAIDAAVAGQAFALEPQRRLDLEQSFSRGFSHGFLGGINHQVLVPGRFPKSRGVCVGTVTGKTQRGLVVQVEPTHPADILKPGDGIVIDEGHPDQDEQGGRVVEVSAKPKSRCLELVFHRGSVNLSAVMIGSYLWKTDDPALRRRMEQTFARDVVVNRDPVQFVISGSLDDGVQLVVSDGAGRLGCATWPGPLQRAERHPVTIELLREQLGRLGDTPFELSNVESHLPADAMVPKSVLNQLRRAAVAELHAVRDRREVAIHRGALDELRKAAAACKAASPTPRELANGNARESRLCVLVRTAEQLDAAIEWRPGEPLARIAMVYCDFEDVRRYKDAVAKARSAGTPIGLGTLRITKPGEEGLLRHIAKAEPDAVLVRNLAALDFFRTHAHQVERVGDFSLNVANELTAELFAGAGLDRLTPSYDLNWPQLAALLGRIDSRLFEIVIHQHMPMFHMEHCVFAAMLSGGKDSSDCGRPCDRHRVELRDRVGAAFPLLADTGCRNTVFNSVPQSAAEYVPKMLALGVRHFRVELLRATAEQTRALLESYARLMAGMDASRQVWRGLQVLNQLGVTRGTLQSA